MEYTPIKDTLRRLIRRNALFTRLFFSLLGILFLRARYVKRELRKLLQQRWQSGKMLDAGFGYGQYSYWIARHFPQAQLTAVEIEPGLMEDFQIFLLKTKTGNILLQESDLRRMTGEAAFDLALSVDVMEHIEDDESVFANIYRSLKNEGVFLMHTPHIRASASRGKGAFVGEHFREGYRAMELKEKLRRAGFNRIDHSLTYGPYGGLAWKLLQQFPLIMLNESKLFLPLLPFYLLIAWPFAEVLMRLDMKCVNREGDGILVKAWKD